MGDRVRMQDHALDDGVFIRWMATRGHLGGIAWATPQALRVLDAAGCDVVLVETVGVGQSEVEVVALADTTVVLLAPGMGDGIQAAKAGILEVADVFAVNKADREGADQTIRDLKHMISLGRQGTAGPSWAARSCLLRRRRLPDPGRTHRRRDVADHPPPAQRRHLLPSRQSPAHPDGIGTSPSRARLEHPGPRDRGPVLLGRRRTRIAAAHLLLRHSKHRAAPANSRKACQRSAWAVGPVSALGEDVDRECCRRSRPLLTGQASFGTLSLRGGRRPTAC